GLDTVGQEVIEEIQADVATLKADVDAVKAEVDREFSHRSYIFPDMASDIDLTCTFTSGAIDEFGAWAEITDSGATTLSSIAAVHALHISALRIRTTSRADKLYVIEIGYGLAADAVTILDPHGFGSGTKKIDSDEQVRFRPPVIPQGQKVYYRMKTEDILNATATVELRYHYHPV
ncbi:unnamed protein product, partial [marine sediment metagenome]